VEPKYQELSISELARAMGVDGRTVAKRLAKVGSNPTLEELIGALITSEGIEEARRRLADICFTARKLEYRSAACC